MPSADDPNLTTDFEALDDELGRHFVPTTPIEAAKLFCGRKPQIRQVVDAINQPGMHAILYGEPGVGKTSLAKILATRLQSRGAPILSPHVNCDTGDISYNSIWRKVFSEIQIISERHAPGFDQRKEKTAAPLIDKIKGEVTPDVVRQVLTNVSHGKLVYIILDEFDKIPDPKVRSLIADTIKMLSDRAVPVTVILVGVASDVTGLIGDHQSVERCLAQVPMPRMSREELQEIVTNGLSAVGMTIEISAINEITGLSKGLPHYTHLLTLHSARKALDGKSLVVAQKHVKDAISTAIAGTQQSIRTKYDSATYSTKKALYEQVLLACAMAEADDLGRFLPSSVMSPMSKIMGKRYTTEHFSKHLHAFCEISRGPVLEKTGQEFRWRYRFANPLMQPYVLMKGLAGGVITEADLRLQFDADGQGRLPLTDQESSSGDPAPPEIALDRPVTK